MELRQLRYFVNIVEHGSLGRAALELDVGVSALSQRMMPWRRCCVSRVRHSW
mgnify:CR=1 FL=1